MLEKFISFLKENDWKIEENGTECDVYSNAVLSAYEPLPAAFIEFIQKFKSVISGDEKRFFLCLNSSVGQSICFIHRGSLVRIQFQVVLDRRSRGEFIL